MSDYRGRMRQLLLRIDLPIWCVIAVASSAALVVVEIVRLFI